MQVFSTDSRGFFPSLRLRLSGHANMIICSSINACTKNFVGQNFHVQAQMGSSICSIVSRKSARSCCFYSHNSKSKYCSHSVSKTLPFPPNSNQTFQKKGFNYFFFKQRSDNQTVMVNGFFNDRGLRQRKIDILLASQGLNMKLSVLSRGVIPKIKCTMGTISMPKRCASAGLLFGLLICYCDSKPVHAAADGNKDDEEEDPDLFNSKLSHGKQVCTDYSVIGIPGDGRCLFRSVAHGACLRSGKPAPSESLQRELADDLRARVADEFIRKREETEWFIEGDFDTYVSQMRKPHVWGGEPELFMASHVLQMPITVYMHDKDAGGLISIAEYGQEYGKDNPIRVLYHGFGHYDALQIRRPASKL